jgi:hypothetical protein
MKVKTFGSLPEPYFTEYKDVYEKFLNVEINAENSKRFLTELSQFNDKNWETQSLIKYLTGKKQFNRRYKGIWSFFMGEDTVHIVSLKSMLLMLDLEGEMKMRSDSIK